MRHHQGPVDPAAGPDSNDRFRRLPEPIRLEDTVATHETDPAPDPDGGRNPNTDFMLRYAG